MNIYAKIVATLKYIERVNWCVSKGTLAIGGNRMGYPCDYREVRDYISPL